MTEETELENRVRDLEVWRGQVQGGKRIFLWMCSVLGVMATIMLALWDRLSGDAP